MNAGHLHQVRSVRKRPTADRGAAALRTAFLALIHVKLHMSLQRVGTSRLEFAERACERFLACMRAHVS